MEVYADPAQCTRFVKIKLKIMKRNSIALDGAHFNDQKSRYENMLYQLYSYTVIDLHAVI